MDKDVLTRGYAQAAKAVERLDEAVAATARSPNELLRDALIQRFEFSYELLWKLFRKVHILRGVPPDKARRAFECIAEAGAAGWLRERALWEQMIKDRNFTSHEYDEISADDIAKRIREHYFPEMQRALAVVKSRFIDRTPLDDWTENA